MQPNAYEVLCLFLSELCEDTSSDRNSKAFGALRSPLSIRTAKLRRTSVAKKGETLQSKIVRAKKSIGGLRRQGQVLALHFVHCTFYIFALRARTLCLHLHRILLKGGTLLTILL